MIPGRMWEPQERVCAACGRGDGELGPVTLMAMNEDGVAPITRYYCVSECRMRCDHCGIPSDHLSPVVVTIPAARYTSEAGAEVDVIDPKQHHETWCQVCFDSLPKD